MKSMVGAIYSPRSRRAQAAMPRGREILTNSSVSSFQLTSVLVVVLRAV